MKKVVFVIVLLALASAGVVAFQMGWLSKLNLGVSPSATASGKPQAVTPGQNAPGAAGTTAPGTGTAEAEALAPGTSPSTTEAAGSAAAAGSSAAAASQAPVASATDATGAPLLPAPAFDGNVASIDFGGTLESWTDARNDSSDRQDVLSGRKEAKWIQFNSHTPGPAELVVSFFAREPMLVDRVVLRVLNGATVKAFPKDVEIWASTAANIDGTFQQVATASLPAVAENGDTSVSFGPVEARFLKLRMLSSQGGKDFALSNLKVMEAKRAGYVPLLARHPELQWPGGPNRLPAVKTAAADTGTCAPPAPAAPPAHAESRRILLVGEGRGMHLAGNISEQTPAKSPLRNRVQVTLDAKYVAGINDDVPQEERGVLTRGLFRFVAPQHARPAILAPAVGFDTVVLAQMCNVSARMQRLSKEFKQALMAWVANGHKLIIQDSDDCTPGPDYGFVPFKFKTDNPGARGAKGYGLRFVESNTMLQGRGGRPGFLDVDAWLNEPRGRGYRNELGDANTFVGWDANWCGQLAVRNINNVMGFALAYAHYGRGLIIYDGFDNDQIREAGYDKVVIRELAQGFDPDGLPCGARLGDFVVTTDTALLERAAVPGRTYTYPLTLLSNRGYTGTVNLAAAPQGVSGIETRFEPASVPVAGEAASALSVTLPGSLSAPAFGLRVTGSDAAGTTSWLCLRFGPPTTGELSIVSALAPPTKTRKNLEIILDASGSMKTAMGKKDTRWSVALDTLQNVISRLPDDFNVGLRMYGHREASRSPKTCTDSQLIVPIAKINRQTILSRAKGFKPKGETPLVYSALQAPDDLKAVGGGTVILITDGEESCKGDPVKAAADLKGSGLDIRLNIVGFALKNPKTQKELTGFAQSTGGLFYSAESGEALGDALMLAAIEKFPFTVFDSAGKVVVSGEANAGTDTLPPGDYKVVIKAGTRELVAPRVTITAGQSVTLKIAMKKGQLVLE